METGSRGDRFLCAGEFQGSLQGVGADMIQWQSHGKAAPDFKVPNGSPDVEIFFPKCMNWLRAQQCSQGCVFLCCPSAPAHLGFIFYLAGSEGPAILTTQALKQAVLLTAPPNEPHRTTVVGLPSRLMQKHTFSSPIKRPFKWKMPLARREILQRFPAIITTHLKEAQPA